MINYYYQKTGIKFDYIELEQFLEYILQESDLSISFYIKDNIENNIETLKYNVTSQLEYLRAYNNIEILNVYGYAEYLPKSHSNFTSGGFFIIIQIYLFCSLPIRQHLTCLHELYNYIHIFL